MTQDNKHTYEKPSMIVIKIDRQMQLLQASVTVYPEETTEQW
jgi:hypothetical protein